MSRAEFLRWRQFHALYPFDDMHRFYRPAALVAGALGGGGPQAMRDRLQWLQPDPRTDGMSEADMNTLRAFGITPGAAKG